MSSSTTLDTLVKALDDNDTLRDGHYTPSLEKALSIEKNLGDEEKQQNGQSDSAENPPPMSRARLSLLVLGLCLSMFLVALDFVIPLQCLY